MKSVGKKALSFGTIAFILLVFVSNGNSHDSHVLEAEYTLYKKEHPRVAIDVDERNIEFHPVTGDMTVVRLLWDKKYLPTQDAIFLFHHLNSRITTERVKKGEIVGLPKFTPTLKQANYLEKGYRIDVNLYASRKRMIIKKVEHLSARLKIASEIKASDNTMKLTADIVEFYQEIAARIRSGNLYPDREILQDFGDGLLVSADIVEQYIANNGQLENEQKEMLDFLYQDVLDLQPFLYEKLGGNSLLRCPVKVKVTKPAGEAAMKWVVRYSVRGLYCTRYRKKEKFLQLTSSSSRDPGRLVMGRYYKIWVEETTNGMRVSEVEEMFLPRSSDCSGEYMLDIPELHIKENPSPVQCGG